MRAGVAYLLSGLIVSSLAINACNTTPAPPPTATPTVVVPTGTPISQRLTISTVGASTNYFSGEGKQEAAFDGDPTTGWVPNEGAGAWIRVTFPTTMTVTSIRLYFLAPRGSRVQDLRLTFSDGSSQEIRVADQAGWQEFALRPVATSTLQLTALTMTESASRQGLPVYLPEWEIYGF